MKIASDDFSPSALSAHERLQVYNGLDCAVTLEVLEETRPMLGENMGDPNFDPMELFLNYSKMSPEERDFYKYSSRQLMYNFERALQGPVLDMMVRGWRIDLYYRDKALHDPISGAEEGLLKGGLLAKKEKVQRNLNRIAAAVWGGPLNPNSPKQLKAFFYETMGLPPQYRYDKGEKKITTNREALEKLHPYFYARPFVNHILTLRDISKKISVLTSEVDDDKRMRTSYNITGTETARFSSSQNAFGGGTNLQNLTEELRRCFIADYGYKLAYVDLEQAESRALGWVIYVLFGDPVYLDACESDDLHTEVCKLIWPELPWTGNPKRDKELADETLFYRHFSYRYLAKRGGHGTNYFGKPFTMARHLHVLASLIEEFQNKYFDRFPGIRRYHRWVAERIQTLQFLSTPLGMGRHFFARPNDDSTLREGIAFIPQSIVAKLLNLAMWRVWRYLPQVQLLGQVHDAIVIQYREEEEEDVLPKVLNLMLTPLEFGERKMTIPAEAKVGWNWKQQLKDDPQENPDGLIKWTGADTRRRTEFPPTNGLDRRLS